MTMDYLFEDADHFEEGLVHLVDMLELADPRRVGAGVGQQMVEESGISLPTGGSFEEWRASCMDISKSLAATRSQVDQMDGKALIDAAIDRISLMLSEPSEG